MTKFTAQIATARTAAAEAGDLDTVAMCDRAHAGEDAALRRLIRAGSVVATITVQSPGSDEWPDSDGPFAQELASRLGRLYPGADIEVTTGDVSSFRTHGDAPDDLVRAEYDALWVEMCANPVAFGL